MALTLSEILFKDLPINDRLKSDMGVERALQERRAAATALQCLGANIACLRLALEDVMADEQTAQEIKELLEDINKNLAYDELEIDCAGEEL